MAVYTTQVRTICENAYLTLHNSSDEKILWDKMPEEIINEVVDIVLPFTFPLWSDGSTTVVDVKKAILQHFYMREIGSETVGLWKLRLRTVLQEQMQWISEMVNKKIAMDDIFQGQNQTYSETIARNKKENTTETKGQSITSDNDVTSSVSSSTDKTTNADSTRSYTDDTHADNSFSDTPQNGLQAVKSGTYLTTASIDNNTNSYDEISNTKAREGLTNTSTQTLNDEKTQQLKENGGRDVEGNESETRNYTITGNVPNKVDVWEKWNKIHFNAMELVINVVSQCFLAIY